MLVLHVKILGEVRLQFGNRIVSEFPTRHAEALIVFLFLHQQSRHTRDKLAYLLWQDCLSDRARARLSTALWQLRRCFTDLGTNFTDCFQVTREHIICQPQLHMVLDVTDFEQHIREANQAQTPSEQCCHLWDALALYQGELCPGNDADWCLLERERLARLALRARGQLVEYFMLQNQFCKAIEQAQLILCEDPLREEIHRALMECHWQLGEYSQAIHQFHQCADMLMADLQVLPLPETLSLYQEIVMSRLKATNQRLLCEAKQIRLQTAVTAFLQAGQELDTLLDDSC